MSRDRLTLDPTMRACFAAPFVVCSLVVVAVGIGCTDARRPCRDDAQCDAPDVCVIADGADVGVCGSANEGEGEGGEGEGEPGAIAATRVEVGGAFACAIDVDQFVQCWGGNSRGQLGRVTDGQRDDTPARIPGLDHVTDLAAGEFHACAFGSYEGSRAQVYCWGDAIDLGAGAGVVDVGVLVAPDFPVGFGVDVKDIASAGNDSNAGSVTCATDGTDTFCFGARAPDAAVTEGRPVEVAALAEAATLDVHSQGLCARRANLDVVCVDVGVGLGLLGCRDGEVCPALGGGAVYSVGVDVACVIGGGTVSCAGSNAFGVVDPAVGADAGDLPLTPLLAAIDVDVGTQHACAVAGVAAQCWGRPLFGATGTSESNVGETHTCADGVSRCHGFREVELPAGVFGVVAISQQGAQVCAITSDGRIVCWGGISPETETAPHLIPLRRP